jgi:hypothetical protein
MLFGKKPFGDDLTQVSQSDAHAPAPPPTHTPPWSLPVGLAAPAPVGARLAVRWISLRGGLCNQEGILEQQTILKASALAFPEVSPGPCSVGAVSSLASVGKQGDCGLW